MASARVLFPFNITLLLDVITWRRDAAILLFRAIRSLKTTRFPAPCYSLVLLRVVASSRLGFSLRSEVLPRRAIAMAVACTASDSESVHVTTGVC
jgi:hypothetical protein